jgi:hypothetical protein
MSAYCTTVPTTNSNRNPTTHYDTESATMNSQNDLGFE